MSESAIHESVTAPPPSGEIRAQFQALATNCGVWLQRARSKVALTGADRVRWLNGQITNNIRDLKPGHGVYAFRLDPQGHILGDLYAYNRGESLLLDVEKARQDKLLELFRRYIIMDKVELSDVSSQVAAVGITGPRAVDKLSAAGIQVPELEPLQIAEVTWENRSVTLVRGDHPVLPEFELWLSPDDLPETVHSLSQAGAVTVSEDVLELLRIASGIPRYGQDIRDKDLPQETGQLRALNFTKGCYVGQEIVERIRSRGNVHRMFTGFWIDGPLPAPGTRIQAEGKDVGEITSAALLPLQTGDRAAALGYVRREAADKPLQAGEAVAKVVSLPLPGLFREDA